MNNLAVGNTVEFYVSESDTRVRNGVVLRLADEGQSALIRYRHSEVPGNPDFAMWVLVERQVLGVINE